MGRRARPKLEVKNSTATNLERVITRSNPYEYTLEFTLSIEIENSGLVWADMSQFGFVLVKSVDPVNPPRKMPTSLSEYIDLQAVQLQSGANVLEGRPYHYPGECNLEKPFSTKPITVGVRVPLSLHEILPQYDWKAALYLLAKNCAPIWYQITFRIDNALNKILKPVREYLDELPANWPGLSVVKVSEGRPVVGWVPIGGQDEDKAVVD